MGVIKELRSWFTNFSVGEEAFFSKQRKGEPSENRVFKNTHIPDEQVFKKLFASILFALNSEDRARETGENIQVNTLGKTKVKGGHVTIATDEEAKNFDNGDELCYTRTVRPDQLPEVKESPDVSLSINDVAFDGKTLERIIDATGSRNKYQYKISDEYSAWLKGVIEAILQGDPAEEQDTSGFARANTSPRIGAVDAYWGTDATLTGNWLICDGKTLSNTGGNGDYRGEEYEALYYHLSTVAGLGTDQIDSNWNGGTAVSLPNLQGMFLRGVGTQAVFNVDYTGQGLGQKIPDSLQNHVHTGGAGITATFPGDTDIIGELDNNDGSSLILKSASATETSEPESVDSELVRTGTETKPVSIGINYIIRY